MSFASRFLRRIGLSGASSFAPDARPRVLALPFSRRVSVEDQLAAFKAIGIGLNAGVHVEDLYRWMGRDCIEKRPYRALVDAMSMHRLAWPDAEPISDCLWSFDFDCIRGPGSYASILHRVDRVCGRKLQIAGIQDDVDLEGGRARLSFELAGEARVLPLLVAGGCIDTRLFATIDALLAAAGSSTRLYWNPSRGLLAGLEEEQRNRFVELTRIPLSTPR